MTSSSYSESRLTFAAPPQKKTFKIAVLPLLELPAIGSNNVNILGLQLWEFPNSLASAG